VGSIPKTNLIFLVATKEKKDCQYFMPIATWSVKNATKEAMINVKAELMVSGQVYAREFIRSQDLLKQKGVVVAQTSRFDA
jgi:hypothetical protein